MAQQPQVWPLRLAGYLVMIAPSGPKSTEPAGAQIENMALYTASLPSYSTGAHVVSHSTAIVSLVLLFVLSPAAYLRPVAFPRQFGLLKTTGRCTQ